MAFEKATNFEPRITTKQSINSRKIHEVNHIDIGHEDEVEINEVHIRNPNYKGKNYDPNYAQNRVKTTNNTNNTSSHNTSTNQNLTAYDDIRLFPELYDTSTIIERVTSEADLIERQLR